VLCGCAVLLASAPRCSLRPADAARARGLSRVRLMDAKRPLLATPGRGLLGRAAAVGRLGTLVVVNASNPIVMPTPTAG